MKSHKHLLLSFLILFFFIKGNTQSLEKQFDDIASEMFQPNQPGAAILISKEGRVTYKKAFGLANVELDLPMKTDMVFEIGSLTKQFTAVAILQLMEKGKLDLNDPVTKYIPDYPTNGSNITIHHLLTHTAGIPNYTNMEKWSKVWRHDLTIIETIELFKNEPLEFKAGEKFSYSNSGYVLLGYIIEKTSGMKYETYLDENIFKPSKMLNTQFGSREKIIKKRASGYQKNSTLVNASYLSFSQPHAAGALMSTADDLFLWNKALRNNSLVKKENLLLAETNYKNLNGKNINYGYGWLINELYGSPTIEHGGGIFGFVSYALYLPKEDIYIIVLTNCDSYNPESIAVKLAAASIDKKVINNKIKPIDTKLATKYVGSYKFDDNMTRNIILENNKLFSQIAGGSKIALIPLSENEFAYEGFIDARIRFEITKNTTKSFIINRINIKEGVKVIEDHMSPPEIVVAEQILKMYAGDYLIAPSLTFQVTTEQNRLFLQFPGQPKIQAFATSESHFFTKLGDAKLEFNKNPITNDINLIIKQNGQTITAKKKSL